MINSKICNYLDWDSQFFGLRIARVSKDALFNKDLKEILMWCKQHSIDCLYLLTTFEDKFTLRQIENNNFQIVDIRITFKKTIERNDTSSIKNPFFSIRIAQDKDISLLRLIAKRAHRDSRFYFDSKFPDNLCDLLYEEWIEKSCKGYADKVFVAIIKEKPVGYISCDLLTNHIGQIGLLGVDEKHQGKGIGSALINAAIRWFFEKGVRSVIVVTQGRNINAIQFYQAKGFIISQLQLWYHKWFEQGRDTA
jgi:dTDP-4-amino-4,6-dideoxy-D-galactose acyltransferase